MTLNSKQFERLAKFEDSAKVVAEDRGCPVVVQGKGVRVVRVLPDGKTCPATREIRDELRDRGIAA